MVLNTNPEAARSVAVAAARFESRIGLFPRSQRFSFREREGDPSFPNITSEGNTDVFRER